MRRLLAGGVMLLLLGAGCASPSSNPLPDEFWAYGTWRFDADESVYTAAPKGVAMLTMHFTAQTADQYLIEGTLDYDTLTLSCTAFGEGSDVHPTCRGTDECAVVGTTQGVVTGVAVVRDGKLVMTPKWVTKPDEAVTWTCNSTTSPAQSGWSVWMTMGNLGAKIIDETWSVDVDGAASVDDLPTDVATDEKTIMATFDTVANDVTAKGVIGFYRALPTSE